MKTQRQFILNWLEKGRSITPIQALSYWGCFRLGARIHELRRMGYMIETHFVSRKGKTFAQYKLFKT
jgi:hypothetical protein